MISSDIRSTLSKVAGLEKSAQAGATMEAGKALAQGGFEMGKWQLKALASLLAGTSIAAGVGAGAAASKLTEPSANDIEKVENELSNAQVDRATAQIERSVMSEEELARKARKKAKAARTLRLD